MRCKPIRIKLNPRVVPRSSDFTLTNSPVVGVDSATTGVASTGPERFVACGPGLTPEFEAGDQEPLSATSLNTLTLETHCP